MNDYDDRRAKEREEQRAYERAVFYEVWSSGSNPDHISDDRVIDSYYEGRSAESAARREIKAMRPKEEVFDEQFPDQEDYYQ